MKVIADTFSRLSEIAKPLNSHLRKPSHLFLPSQLNFLFQRPHRRQISELFLMKLSGIKTWKMFTSIINVFSPLQWCKQFFDAWHGIPCLDIFIVCHVNFIFSRSISGHRLLYRLEFVCLKWRQTKTSRNTAKNKRFYTRYRFRLTLRVNSAAPGFFSEKFCVGSPSNCWFWKSY